MHQPSIRILATGGTIAGRAGSAMRRDYRAGQVDISALLDSTVELGLEARLDGRQIANIDSADIDWEIWCRLRAEIGAAIEDPDCDGVIVTHGTDTAEETAFLLDQTLPTSKPVVLVGAMRPVDAIGSDGLRNLATAVRVAGDRDAAGRGVLLIMGDQVLSARDARKALTGGTNAFRSYPRGPVALATPTTVDWTEAPWRLGEEARFAWPMALPKVPILHAFAGMQPHCVQMLCDAGAQGIVLAGFGEGNSPSVIRSALAEAAAEGKPVVRSTRADEGLVDREPDDDKNGFIAARALGPAKARILLQLLIASGVTDAARSQDAFDGR